MSTEQPSDDLLTDLYYDPASPVGYSGNRDKFYEYAKKEMPTLSRKRVYEYFSRQKAYTNRACAKYKFKRRQVVSYDIYDLAMTDLGDMSSLKRFNSGYRYILLVVDVLSKMIWTRPLKRKTGKETMEAMADIFKSLPKGKTFLKMQSDAGGEYLNSWMRQLMKENGVTTFHTENYDVKASVAEVNICILKHRLWRYMNGKKTKRWVDALEDITKSRNSAVFPGHGFKPIDVNEMNAGIVFRRLYPRLARGLRRFPLKHKYKVGQKVKLSVLRNPLIHSFYGTYTQESYIVHSQLNTDPVTYRVTNEEGDVMRGTVYEDELLPVY